MRANVRGTTSRRGREIKRDKCASLSTGCISASNRRIAARREASEAKLQCLRRALTIHRSRVIYYVYQRAVIRSRSSSCSSVYVRRNTPSCDELLTVRRPTTGHWRGQSPREPSEAFILHFFTSLRHRLLQLQLHGVFSVFVNISSLNIGLIIVSDIHAACATYRM